MLGLSLVSISSFADGIITQGDQTIAESGNPQRNLCDADDEESQRECSTTILRILSGINIGSSQISGGWISVANDANDHKIGKFSVSAVKADLPIGDFQLARFDFAFVPGLEAIRLRFVLADSEVLFICRDRKGKIRLPAIGRAYYRCSPDTDTGFGGRLLETQWDSQTGRFAGRWAELNSVFNLLGSVQAMSYLRKHLNTHFGVSAESIWYGDQKEGSAHVARAVLGFSGLIRSENSHWEANGNLIFRPVLFGTEKSFKDFGLESKVQVLYHFLNTNTTVVSTGLEWRANYWSNPLNSIGDYALENENFSMFIGGVLGVRYGFKRF